MPGANQFYADRLALQMTTRSNRQKEAVLGMPFGTACGRLRRIMMFELLRRHNENVCYRCGGLIEGADDLTLEHKQSWQTNGAALFWDVNNIAFSHVRCNIRDGYVKREIIDGKLWCPSCSQSLSIECFHRERRERTGYAPRCKSCSNAKRRKTKARGDCISCGAARDTKPFRVSHNICIECHNKHSGINTKNRLGKQRAQALCELS